MHGILVDILDAWVGIHETEAVGLETHWGVIVGTGWATWEGNHIC